MTLLILAYLGGVLTILSPCILPVLPFIFARTGQSFARSTLPMLAGLAMTFTAVATLAAGGGGWAVQANGYGRFLAVALLAVFGVTLLSPRLATLLARPVVAGGNRLLGAAGGPRSGVATTPTVGGALLLGVATGLLWAPCAGPILGLVLTGAALRGADAQTGLLLAAYAAGAATSLAVALLVGGRIVVAVKRLPGAGPWVRRGLGVAVLAGVAAIGLGVDTGLLARLPGPAAGRVEQVLFDAFGPEQPKLAPVGAAGVGAAGSALMPVAGDADRAFRSDLPIEGRLPALDGAVAWLNSPPLTAGQLRGKVVLIDFWTYSCINCIRMIPYVRAWAEKYKDQGLVVIGVHAPEFAFEKKIGNVKAAIDHFQIDFPVAIDNDFRIWRAFRNSYWPAYYVVDAEGQVRYHQFGEGGYRKAEEAIQALLAEAGSRTVESAPVTPDAKGVQAAPEPGSLRSGETYIGYRQASNFASPQGLKRGTALDYTAVEPGLNAWSLAGNWTVGPEQATLNRPGGGIAYRFSARDLHLVLGPAADGKPVRFQVTIDGKAPGASHGADIDADGNGIVTQTRLYQLVRQAGGVEERRFEVRFLDPGVEAFVFTFG